MMRILILSNHPWKNNNSFGNTYSSIFGKVPNTKIAHIYMFEGKPDPIENIIAYYHISEREVIRSVFFRKDDHGVGKKVDVPIVVENDTEIDRASQATIYGKLLSFGKLKHWTLMFLAREMAWKLGHVNYKGLLEFVADFKPDIFFLPFSNTYYTNRLALFIKNHYDIPMVMEMAMDHYSLKRVSLDPLFWIDRFGKRRMIRRLAGRSELIYTISKKLKDELEGSLKTPCRVLYKTPDRSRALSPYKRSGDNIKFLFTGNISANRWKSLSLIARELHRQRFGHLDIYTQSSITKMMKKALCIDGYSTIYPPVSQSKVIDLQNEADVLVHAEAFDIYNKSLVRCAISTKIMDYLSVGRCILAVGPSDISSIEYLAENDIALIANSKEQLTEQLSRIKNDSSIISEYATRGGDYARNVLDEHKIREEFYLELQRIVDNYKK